ncbi:MAG: HEPN domain-containing protein [Hadesarchaea archaeon]|nr:HEPN domain-containing protein [Hadesarchaea archaeon]
MRRMENLVEKAWKAEREGKLKRVNVDWSLVEGHIRTSRHCLTVAKCLHELNTKKPSGWEFCPDSVIQECYYAMYHRALSFLARKGWASEDHLGTIGKLIELLREERKHVEASSLGKILDDARKLREVARYAVYSEALQDKVPEMLTKAEKFILELERIEGV